MSNEIGSHTIDLNRFSIAREADEKKGGETGWMGWKRTNGVLMNAAWM